MWERLAPRASFSLDFTPILITATVASKSSAGTGYSVANEKHYDAWGKVRYDGAAGSSGQNLDASFDPYFGEGG